LASVGDSSLLRVNLGHALPDRIILRLSATSTSAHLPTQRTREYITTHLRMAQVMEWSSPSREEMMKEIPGAEARVDAAKKDNEHIYDMMVRSSKVRCSIITYFKFFFLFFFCLNWNPHSHQKQKHCCFTCMHVVEIVHGCPD
jgi:hypothetical protein